MTISINVNTWAELEDLCRAVLQNEKAEAVKAAAEVVAPQPEQKSVKPEQKEEVPEQKSTKAEQIPKKASVSMDDIKRRALALMDAGKQPELEKLLRNYGVLSIPELEADPVKMAAFAADLEAM